MVCLAISKLIWEFLGAPPKRPYSWLCIAIMRPILTYPSMGTKSNDEKRINEGVRIITCLVKSGAMSIVRLTLLAQKYRNQLMKITMVMVTLLC